MCPTSRVAGSYEGELQRFEKHNPRDYTGQCTQSRRIHDLVGVAPTMITLMGIGGWAKKGRAQD